MAAGSPRTLRQRIRDAFAGVPSAVPPVSIRLDLWHREAAARRALPPAVRAMTPEEVEDHLGFARAARHRAAPVLRLASGDIATLHEGDQTVVEYRLPDRTIRAVSVLTPDLRRAGMAAHMTQYPLTAPADCVALTRALENARLNVNVAGFDALDATTGDRGMPLFICGSCPAHHVMLQWCGYEGFYYLQADCPQEIEALIQALDRLMRRDLWPAVVASRAELVLHGNHFSSQMTPPPLFERWFVPYFAEFNRRMHAVGKKVLWHADAEMGRLLRHVLEAGFDGADCLATRPLAPETLADYLKAWQGRIVCWGGLPSLVFDPSYPFDDFRRLVDETARLVAGRSDVIVGASDNVLPGAEWRRLLYVRDVFCRPA